MSIDLLLKSHLKTLKLPTILQEYARAARQCAQEDRSFEDFLHYLVELEVAQRQRKPVSDDSKKPDFPRKKRSPISTLWLYLPLTRNGSSTWVRVILSLKGKALSFWDHRVWAKPIWPLLWGGKRVGEAIASGFSPRPDWPRPMPKREKSGTYRNSNGPSTNAI